MSTTHKPFLELTAADLMTSPVVMISQDTPLRVAASLLARVQKSGAAVVNQEGRCVGVLSAGDIVRQARPEADLAETVLRRPRECSFQDRFRVPDDEEVLCTLPTGGCPIQGEVVGTEGNRVAICRLPRCVCVDWQVVDLECIPADQVRQYMTADVLTVQPAAPVSELARTMLAAHIHRVVVVDESRRPVGILSSMDILTALASLSE
jgi:CBS domain-containing protein